MTGDLFLDLVAADGRRLVAAAESNWARPVPDCPDWDAAECAVAVHGGPAPTPLDDHVAAAGIEEFLTEFLPGLLAQPTADRPSGTLHLQLTDAATDSWLDLDDHGNEAPADADADTTVRGTAWTDLKR